MEEAKFFETLKHYRLAPKYPLHRFLNFDQTVTPLVPAEKRRIEEKGAKQVLVFCPSGAKITHTVTLIVGADGKKYPSVIVFKTSNKNGKLLPHVLKKLEIPKNVIILASRSGWWTQELDKELFEVLFPRKQRSKVILLRDQSCSYSCNCE